MKRKLIPLLLVISSFFMFACGLTNILPGNETEAIATPQDEMAATEPMPEEQETQPETAETTSAASPTEGIQPEMESACYHPYFPVIEGASWTYVYESGGGYTLTIEETDENTFTMTQEMEDEETVFMVEWYCSENGILRGTFGQIDLLSEASEMEDAEITFETMEWEGETLPAPELMEVGYTWTAEYKMNGEMEIEGVATSIDMTILMEYTVGAIEEVTVPAGTFPKAVRIDNNSNIELFMGAGETDVPLNTMNYSSSTWYAEDVGMLKTSSSFSGFSSVVELKESSLVE